MLRKLKSYFQEIAGESSNQVNIFGIQSNVLLAVKGLFVNWYIIITKNKQKVRKKYAIKISLNVQ